MGASCTVSKPIFFSSTRVGVAPSTLMKGAAAPVFSSSESLSFSCSLLLDSRYWRSYSEKLLSSFAPEPPLFEDRRPLLLLPLLPESDFLVEEPLLFGVRRDDLRLRLFALIADRSSSTSSSEPFFKNLAFSALPVLPSPLYSALSPSLEFLLDFLLSYVNYVFKCASCSEISTPSSASRF